MDLRPGEFARQQDRRHRDDIARRFEGAAASGGAIGVKRFDLVAYSNGLTQIFGPACDANAPLVGLVCLCRQIGPMQRVDADQVEPQFACGNAREFQPFPNDFERQPSARQRARAGIGNLALADIAVDIADRNLQRSGALGAASAADAYAIPSDFLDSYLRKIRRYVGLEIPCGIVHLVEQLLLASLRRRSGLARSARRRDRRWPTAAGCRAA